jgi:hypothetical protein
VSPWAALGLVNAALALAALTWLTLDTARIWHRMSKRRLFLTLSLWGLLLALLEGAAEAVLGVDLRLWVAIATASCAWCLFGLWASRHDTADTEAP